MVKTNAKKTAKSDFNRADYITIKELMELADRSERWARAWARKHLADTVWIPLTRQRLILRAAVDRELQPECV